MSPCILTRRNYTTRRVCRWGESGCNLREFGGNRQQCCTIYLDTGNALWYTAVQNVTKSAFISIRRCFIKSVFFQRVTERLCVCVVRLFRRCALNSLLAGTAVGVPTSCSLSWSVAEREPRLLTVSDTSLTDHPGLVGKAGTRSEIRQYFANTANCQGNGGVSPLHHRDKNRSVSCFVLARIAQSEITPIVSP